MTIKDIKLFISKELSSLYSSGEAESIGGWLLEDRLGLDRLQLLNGGDKKCSAEQLLILQNDIALLKKAMPLQQILGYTIFYGLKIGVNRNTLIPRPETEELVDWIVSDAKKKHNLRVLDIGTGSACIALALKKNLINAEVSAIDISAEALEMSQRNSEFLKLEIQFSQVDVISDDLYRMDFDFDIVVSNPPYIKEDEMHIMHDNVLKFEPHQALFVYDDDPLLFYKKIVDFVQRKHQKPCAIYFEINERYAADLISYLSLLGISNVLLMQDMQGRDRMLKLSI